MNNLTLHQLHSVIGGQLLVADDCDRAVAVSRIVTDSRHVQRGDCFLARQGMLYDGAEFAEEAMQRGALGVVTNKPTSPPAGRFVLHVQDPQQALWQLARWKRDQFSGRVVAVTGSVGKTTTRQLIDAVLRPNGRTVTSPANYNNHVGLPLAMLGVADEDFAIFELGANQLGEIAALSNLCAPHVGVITNVGDAHLGGFGSRENTARAKSELLDALPADGHAVLSIDDPWLRKSAVRCPARIVWIGQSVEADVSASDVRCGGGELSLRVDGQRFRVPMWGRHHLHAVLAAIAVGRIMGLAARPIAEALTEFRQPAMRCQVARVANVTIINDAYNASPQSMRAALQLLGEMEHAQRRIVVCGDMRELGPAAPQLHRQLGDQVVTVCGADLLLACGNYADEVVVGARRAGMHPSRTMRCQDAAAAATYLRQQASTGDVILVKGSRTLCMEQVIESLETNSCRMAA